MIEKTKYLRIEKSDDGIIMDISLKKNAPEELLAINHRFRAALLTYQKDRFAASRTNDKKMKEKAEASKSRMLRVRSELLSFESC